ncbi:MAG TPA: sialidase family protein [Rhodocyclaceae bacterium]|nr:sialidase family protein [Rhodocyclaceae bacterium]
MLLSRSRLLLLTICMMLVACATNQQMVGGRLALPEKMAPEEGVLLVKLVGIQPLSVFNAKWKSIRLKRKSDDSYVELYDTAPATASYSLFMGTLQPGQYEIAGVESLGPAPGNWGILPALIIMAMASDSQNLNSKFGTFTVKPGVLSNLGTIVSSFSDRKDEPMKVAVLSDEFGRGAALKDVEPTSQGRLKVMPVSTWDKAPENGEGVAALANIRKFASNVAALENIPDNQLLVGSALGTLRVRKADGQWISMAVPGLDTLTYVRALDGGRILAATDAGRYYVGQADKGLWVENQVLSNDYRIVRVEPMGAQGYAVMASTTTMPTLSAPMRTKLFFKKTLDEPGSGQEVMELGFSAVGAIPMFFDGEHLQVYFNHVGISRTLDRYKIHPVTMQKTKDEMSFWALGITGLQDGTLVMDRMNGLSNYVSFSNDKGASWKHGETSGPHSVRFVDANLGYGFSTVSTGWSTVTSILNKTTDGGKTWAKIGKPIETNGLLHVRLVQGTVFVYTSKQLLSTSDDGETWKVETML